MSRAIVFLNGELSDKSFYKGFIQPGDRIFCADGGSEHARSLGLVPELILGDIDSSSEKTVHYFESLGVPVMRLSPVKDETDTQALLRKLDCMPFREVLLAGALGGRIDHTIANIALLEKFNREDRVTAIVSPNERIEVISAKRILKRCKGATVSLLSIGKKSRVTLRGFEYPLADEIIERGDSRGISNIVHSERATIEVHKGKLLMILMEDRK